MTFSSNISYWSQTTRELYKKREDCFIPNIDILKKKEILTYEPLGTVFDRILKGSYPVLYNGQENNASDIGKDVGIDNKTVDDWMSILKNTFLVYLLQPYFNNALGRVIKRPKIYFMDTGLACYLSGYLDSRTLEKSAYSGQIFETYIVSEIIKSYTNNSRDPRLHLYYYRDNNQKEIDLLIVDQNNIYPVEIKKSANPGKDTIKNFNIVEKFEMNSPNGIVLCLSKEIHALDDKNYMIPIEYI